MCSRKPKRKLGVYQMSDNRYSAQVWCDGESGLCLENQMSQF